MRIIHIQTQVTTVLGVLDEDGNVGQTVPLQTTIANLTDEAWADAARQAREQRDQISTDLAEQAPAAASSA